MKYKIGEIHWFKPTDKYRVVGISLDWEEYPTTLNIFFYKRCVTISFVF